MVMDIACIQLKDRRSDALLFFELGSDIMNELYSNLDKIHTTDLGVFRIQKNIHYFKDDVVNYLKEKIKKNCIIYKKGKNYYCEIDSIRITINSYNYCIITVHKL